jgi:multisubunit Na+/H+ antiporter MnhG subunit
MAVTPLIKRKKKYTPNQELTFENTLGGCGCLLGIAITCVAAFNGAPIVWCFATLILGAYLLSFIGKTIDQIVKALKNRKARKLLNKSKFSNSNTVKHLDPKLFNRKIRSAMSC